MGSPVTITPDPAPVTITPDAAPQPRTWLDSAKDFASEAWKQVNPVEAVKGINQAFYHPISTGKAMLEGQDAIRLKAEESFKKGDYGTGVRHVLNYLLPIIGQTTDQAGDLIQSGQVARGAGMTAGLAANIAAPELVKGANLKIPTGEVPQTLYKSALKPSTTLSTGDVRTMVQTGLENKIPVSGEGLNKLNGLIQDLGDKVKSQIQAGSNAGATVDKFKVASRLSDIAKRFETQVNPEADLNAISQAGNEFLRNQPGQIPAAEAQAIKQGTYTQLKSKSYGELASATKESQKALARGIKEELEQQFPEIKGLNAQQGQAMALDDALDRAVRRIDNHQIIGLGTPAATLGGAAVAGGPGAMAAFILKKVVDTPEIKSKLAIALNAAGKGKVSMPPALGRIVAYSNALGNALPNGSQGQ